MTILRPVGFCGMTPKAGATVAAVYMILVTNIYLIFEVGHLERAMTDMAQIKPFNLTEVGKMLPYCYYTAITLAVMTYLVCVFLIYSVQKRLYMGMFAYVAWIIFYDLANSLIVALAYLVSKEAWFSLSPLEWFGLAIRIPMDCFWLFFIVKYALIIIESKGQEGLNVSELPRFRLGSTARKGV
ncbi:transmembrane protein 217-like [Malaclemys terrapin pileata]|uniref:transmembrane protein 217-like n=1 Tax=Malaclemys terrapin pileata TaxID=2991368 RepID=UPI0023A81664|nr:transmembrane protein 217-like [Malaclemys terrapin pileata]XP_053880936.1 transmembrane protein 217-like [Malaclemys terrapin pileata]